MYCVLRAVCSVECYVVCGLWSVVWSVVLSLVWSVFWSVLWSVLWSVVWAPVWSALYSLLHRVLYSVSLIRYQSLFSFLHLSQLCALSSFHRFPLPSLTHFTTSPSFSLSFHLLLFQLQSKNTDTHGNMGRLHLPT